jgi:hypothetical protein
VRRCEVCQKVLRTPGRNWKHCGYTCRLLARYRALGQPVPPPKTREKDRPALPAAREKPAGWIEARMAWWADYHRRNKTYRIEDGWAGWRSTLGGGDR